MEDLHPDSVMKYFVHEENSPSDTDNSFDILLTFSLQELRPEKEDSNSFY
jgi:hypothetical protein